MQCDTNTVTLYSQSVYFGIQVTAAGRSGMLCCLVLWAAHCSSLKSVWAGQGTVLQLWYRTRSPRQKEPPCWGTGESQARPAWLTPPPQDLEHLLQGCQAPHWPCTGAGAGDTATQDPRWHHRPRPHSVPSAHGMCCVYNYTC